MEIKQYRYNKLNEYLKKKYGERTLKICIDGGFTCPNRDGTVGEGGCIFCSNRGSGDHITLDDIQNQIVNYFNSYRANRANKFIVYFQNYTNTYDTIDNLKEKYESLSKNYKEEQDKLKLMQNNSQDKDKENKNKRI